MRARLPLRSLVTPLPSILASLKGKLSERRHALHPLSALHHRAVVLKLRHVSESPRYISDCWNSPPVSGSGGGPRTCILNEFLDDADAGMNSSYGDLHCH